MAISESELRENLVSAAYEAGRAIMEIYAGDFATSRKADRSPVTAADIAAETIILAALGRIAPDVPVVAEEQAAAEGVPSVPAARFFLVDPLDGTKEFIARNGEFTVNIALVDHGLPVLGIVYVPVEDAMYAGGSEGAMRRCRQGPWEKIAARSVPNSGAVMAISRSHAAREKIEAEHFGERIAATLVAGSSLKFCRLAEGVADLYPRAGPTMEWDTAAGDAILRAAGGSVSTLDGQPLAYGKPGLRNPHFIARGRRGG